ncbi:hypothetical protein [Puia dinghuensis]|uniref:Uncharacterized protein n=1 Tax=Puia dinghuensis TaxID=1792502 RepID=A0A8J2UA79_9BACT|nr:hypothetical protein [Puia dinghuensis]GGA90186.1 hypothetical protein GCM10011511_11800 [Puia dinghuensis]
MHSPSGILANLPTGLRTPLIDCYNSIISSYSEHRWEPSELNGGKFCEVVYSIISGYIAGTFPPSPSKPSNMFDACQALGKIPANPGLIGDRSVRILIPRVLPFLYEIRNNRGVGHVGGDVDPNYMDSTAVVNISSWILAELIRVFHNVTTIEAQEMADCLIERRHPLVWEIENVRRVLDSTLKVRDQTLVLLHTRPAWTMASDLFSWVEYSREDLFKARILNPLHKARLIEFDKINDRARISPLGVTEVEKVILRNSFS